MNQSKEGTCEDNKEKGTYKRIKEMVHVNKTEGGIWWRQGWNKH